MLEDDVLHCFRDAFGTTGDAERIVFVDLTDDTLLKVYLSGLLRGEVRLIVCGQLRRINYLEVHPSRGEIRHVSGDEPVYLEFETWHSYHGSFYKLVDGLPVSVAFSSKHPRSGQLWRIEDGSEGQVIECSFVRSHPLHGQIQRWSHGKLMLVTYEEHHKCYGQRRVFHDDVYKWTEFEGHHPRAGEIRHEATIDAEVVPRCRRMSTKVQEHNNHRTERTVAPFQDADKSADKSADAKHIDCTVGGRLDNATLQQRDRERQRKERATRERECRRVQNACEAPFSPVGLSHRPPKKNKVQTLRNMTEEVRRAQHKEDHAERTTRGETRKALAHEAKLARQRASQEARDKQLRESCGKRLAEMMHPSPPPFLFADLFADHLTI